jgi:hypothetical protein
MGMFIAIWIIFQQFNVDNCGPKTIFWFYGPFYDSSLNYYSRIGLAGDSYVIYFKIWNYNGFEK